MSEEARTDERAMHRASVEHLDSRSFLVEQQLMQVLSFLFYRCSQYVWRVLLIRNHLILPDGSLSNVERALVFCVDRLRFRYNCFTCTLSCHL